MLHGRFLRDSGEKDSITEALCGDWKHCMILGKERDDDGISLQIWKPRVLEYIRANARGAAEGHSKL